MSLNPLNELKRRLDDEDLPLQKRFCLAKNVVQSHHFPAAPKERVVSDWLGELSRLDKICGSELKNCIDWLNKAELTTELKACLIQVVSQYLHNNAIQEDDVEYLLTFLDHNKISFQLTQQIDDYLYIIITLLKHLKEQDKPQLCDRIFHNLIKSYKECKRKLEFILKLLDGENIETVFYYLHTDNKDMVINVCQNILFPMNKKSFFISFLQTLIRKDNIDELIAEKGDNIQSVLKIMSAFFTFPQNRTSKYEEFLTDFIHVFVSCFKKEGQLIFAFYVMVVNALNMNQAYLSPAMKMPPIIFENNDSKIKRSIFLNMLETLLQCEVDISVRLTDTFGEKISKVEIKKNFTSFLQAVLLGQLKLEGKLDKNTLQIIKVALKLDPTLIEQKINVILPPIMACKKSQNIKESYTEMMNYLLETLFKLSRGTLFLNGILPHVKLCLETINTEQFELKQKINECLEVEEDCEKLQSKLLTGYDLFPEECIEMYGRCTAELMFRQNKDVLVLLQKDFEEHCLMMLEEGFVSPSIITLSQVLSAILSSFLRYNKMADHTVPRQIAVEFWEAFGNFENECLKKFGECILKLSYDQTFTTAFLKLCQHVTQLKLLNMKYSNVKLDNTSLTTTEINDLSDILPCLSKKQWVNIAKKVKGDSALDDILLLKLIAANIQTSSINDDSIIFTKDYLISQLAANPSIFNTNPQHVKTLCLNLREKDAKILAKSFVNYCLKDTDFATIFTNNAVQNKVFLNAITKEVAKNIAKSFGIEDLAKGLNKIDFDLLDFLKDRDVKLYFNDLTINSEEILSSAVEILKCIPIESLEENYQLLAILVLLITKRYATKKLKKNVDYILRRIYELSPKYPDIYKILPVDFIFSFKDKTMIDLLTLKIKTSNNLLIIKCILESAVKKVKTDSEVVKTIVKRLLSKQTNKRDDISSIDYFSDPVFQISCVILPIIAKERKSITVSAYRSILAELQENIHKSMLECFKNIDFGNNSSLLNETGNIDDSMVVSEHMLATLNAVGAYSLTLSKYCGTTDADEVKNLDYLWSGLEFFVQNAIQSIQTPPTKQQHIESSVQLLNVVLRNIKKLESHTMFQDKDKLFVQIWKSLISRLLLIFEKDSDKRDRYMEEMAASLKFLCELSSVECFNAHFVSDLCGLGELQKPSLISKSEEVPSTLTKHKVFKYIFSQCLKANIVGPKCLALTKLMYKNCKELRFWIQQYYETNYEGVSWRKEKKIEKNDDESETVVEAKVIKIDDKICELLKVDLDIIAEGILAGKKITLDHKSMDALFSLLCVVQYNSSVRLYWRGYFDVTHGCLGVMNNLLVTREQLLEDRWPNYMQSYRSLVRGLCERSALTGIDKATEDRLGETAHCIEKLTQSISKRKSHVSHIASYSVAEICSLLEQHPPFCVVRQHLENGACLLLQTCDWQASGFLRRALAESPGHVTASRVFVAYKRHHKYVGDA